MKKNLALLATPALAQTSPSETETAWAPTLDRLQELPLLGWLVGQTTHDEEPQEEPEPQGPAPEDTPTVVLDPADGGDEARGGWEPWG